MELSWILDIVKGANDLAQVARGDLADRQEIRRRRELQELIEALRQIYFSPRGVISLLNQLAEGQQPSELQIAMILPEFNDYEFRVHRMLTRIDPIAGPVQGRLTLRAERALREISNGKQGIRGRVKDLLNEALTTRTHISREDAIELRDEIIALNNAIEAAEEALVAAVR
jgi:hypothetical protein